MRQPRSQYRHFEGYVRGQLSGPGLLGKRRALLGHVGRPGLKREAAGSGLARGVRRLLGPLFLAGAVAGGTEPT
ncbi:hypothetical protein GCM10027048_34330 [Hymenobacter coalescens]